MKHHRKALWAFLLLCAPPFALAQAGAGWESALVHHLPGMGAHHDYSVQTTNNQRLDLANCMAATTHVQQILNQMMRIGSPWARGRVSYTSHDLTVLADREVALDATLDTLTETHEQLLKSLAETHDRNLAKSLNELDRVQAKLYSSRARISRDLADARPGPGSPKLSWDFYAARKAAGKWQAEHRQIAKELELAMYVAPSRLSDLR